MAARFRSKDTFRIHERDALFIRGDLVEGVVAPGMTMRLEIGPELFATAPVAAVEFADGPGPQTHLVLGITAENPEDLEFWEEHDLAGKVLQIVESE